LLLLQGGLGSKLGVAYLVQSHAVNAAGYGLPLHYFAMLCWHVA